MRNRGRGIPNDPNDALYTSYPDHVEVFTRYDRPLLKQLYSLIRLEQSDIETNMDVEARYSDLVVRLIKFITKEDDLK